MGEDGEVDPEEEEIEDQRDDNETNHSCEEVFGNAFLCYTFENVAICERLSTYVVGFPPVQEVPKVYHNSNADSQDGKNPVDLGRPSASHEHAGGKHPSPPIEREFTVKSV